MRETVFGGTGIPWYRRGDYPRILQIMADAQNLSPTFDEWEQRAKYAERMAKAHGPVYRVEIRPDKFVAWCAARKLNVDAEARKLFAGDPANWTIDGKH